MLKIKELSKEHFKSLPLFENYKANVDRENGIIRNIVIVQEGLDKDDCYFTKEFLQELLENAQGQTNGVKSRFGHPAMCKTTLGTFIGRYKDFSIIEDEGKQKLIANLHLDEITKKTQVEGQGISYYDYIMDMSENNSDMFGNSIHYHSDADLDEDPSGGVTYPVTIYKDLKSFYASDLVDSPCATDNLFKSSDDFGVQVTSFLDANPQIFELVKEKPELIDNFMKRYENYNSEKKSKKSNFKMSFKNMIKSLMGGKFKDVDVTLADGQVITVVTDAENPKVGDKVVDESGAALPDGEYKLPDGQTSYEVEGGLISEIKSEKEEEGEGAGESEEGKETAPTDDQVKELKDLRQFKEEATSSMKEMATEIKGLKESFTSLAKSVKSKNVVVPAGEDTGKKKETPSSGYDAEKAKEFRESRNK